MRTRWCVRGITRERLGRGGCDWRNVMGDDCGMTVNDCECRCDMLRNLKWQ